MERGQPGVVGLERVRVHLSDDNEVSNHLGVLLRHGGMLSAGLEVLSSKPDSLIDHWKLAERHVNTMSERYVNVVEDITGGFRGCGAVALVEGSAVGNKGGQGRVSGGMTKMLRIWTK